MTHAVFTQAMLPRFSDIEPTHIYQDIENIISKNKATISALLSNPGEFTWANLMEPLEQMSDELGKVWSPIAHLHAVMESEPLRKAYNETLPLLTEYHTEISQNADLFKAIISLTKHPEYQHLDTAQHKIIENDIRDFKLSGVDLSSEKKARLSALQKELSQLSTKFSENVLDATHAFELHVLDEKEVEGLPPQALQLAIANAEQRKLEGYLFTLDYPSYSTALKFLKARHLRQQLYEAYATRASDRGPNAGQFDNTKVIENILKARHEMAVVLGFKNFAEYSLATKMAKKTDQVVHFLMDLLHRSQALAQQEYQQLIALAKQLDGLEKIETWDVAYYSEKLREATFDFTQEELRPYFSIDHVLKGLFAVVHQLYGLTIKEEKNIDVWQPQVKFFAIYDDKQQLRGGFYIDLFARANKRDGAWMDECRVRRRLPNGNIQYPVAYLTCNFMPPIQNQPALLTHDDVITLFHEFGHCLHHLLTLVDYASVSGINGVAWDAVEFPSQFLENFCWERDSLNLIAANYQTGAPLPESLYKKMLAAKHFQTGLQMVRQLEFSLFDFRLHLEFDPNIPAQAQMILNEVRAETAIMAVPEFNRFQNSFSHIFAGGYAAGYYSYKWAEVLSADAYALFEENGIFDKQTGLSFMHNILEVGGMREPMESFVAFRGREPTIDALLKQSGMG